MVAHDARKSPSFGWGFVCVCVTPDPAAGWVPLSVVRALAPHMHAKMSIICLFVFVLIWALRAKGVYCFPIN